MRLRPLLWFQSIHAKLFLVTALVTSALTIAVAYSIIHNSRQKIEEYSKQLAIQTSEAVEIDILQRDPAMQDPRKIKEVLESLAGLDRSIFQIDIFQRTGDGQVTLKCSSADESEVEWGPGISSYLALTAPQAELVPLTTGSKAWKVYTPIRNPKTGRPALGLIRTYCDLERWDMVWNANLQNTLRTLPLVLVGEFILLWVVIGIFVKDPLRSIMDAMRRLERGDPGARTHIRRRDELGLIATRFNVMATQLQRAGEERERLIGEVQDLNANLQQRIDEALEELQAKNQELERLIEGNALLREELGQQERLAVAGQLSAAFAHEVGTPLNLVNGHIQLLQAQGELPEKARDRLATIHAQIQRVGDIVRRMLDMTRRPQLHPADIALEHLLEDLQRLWTPTLSAHRVSFGWQAPPDCLLRVDRKQMEQLFINLVNNAVDAMPDGGSIRLKVEVAPKSPEGAARWSFRLTDTGTGIPPDLLGKVFKPMFTTKAEGKGTGLGLAICREIVRNHGGEIRLDSEEGKGTTVAFTLPGA